MIEGALTLENYVVVTRGTGRYYVSESRAENIVNMLNSEDRPFMLKINGNHVGTNDIVGVVTAAQVDDMEKRKRGLWQCGKGNWHNRDETCKCGWGMTDTKKQEEVEEQQTPEEKERAQLISSIREAGLGFRDFIKLKGKTNEELKKMLKDLQDGHRV